MTSPLVRAWFAARIAERKRRARVRFDIRVWVAQRIAEVVDTSCDIWFSFRPERNEFWDTVPYAFRPVDVPAPVAAVVAGTLPGAVTVTLGSPPPALHLMLPCGTCGAHANAPCVTRYGEQTGPHKKRRTASAAAGDLGSPDRDQWDADEYGDHQYDDLPEAVPGDEA